MECCIPQSNKMFHFQCDNLSGISYNSSLLSPFDWTSHIWDTKAEYCLKCFKAYRFTLKHTLICILLHLSPKNISQKHFTNLCEQYCLGISRFCWYFWGIAFDWLSLFKPKMFPNGVIRPHLLANSLIESIWRWLWWGGHRRLKARGG